MEIFLTDDWDEILKEQFIDVSDIYFSKNYVSLYETESEKALCCVARNDEKYMLFPFLSREFTHKGIKYKDFETAYGYGGPLFNTPDTHFRIEATYALQKLFASLGYVAGFIRFHPLFQNYREIKNIGDVFIDRKTIAIDLRNSENEIWTNEIHTKNRNVIKKGIKENLEFIVDDDFLYLEDFIRLYKGTMDRLAATDFYYFNRNYYKDFKTSIPNSFLGVVKLGNEVVSTAIFMYGNKYGHYHLSGSNKAFLKLSPNNFMLWEATKEIKKRGCEFFHLGGGTTSSSDDSLYCFKSRFSRSTFDFAIGKLVFNKSVYQDLIDEWIANNPDKREQYKHFLLKYKY